MFLCGALDSHPFFPSHVVSGRCFLSAAASGALAGVVSAFAPTVLFAPLDLPTRSPQNDGVGVALRTFCAPNPDQNPDQEVLRSNPRSGISSNPRLPSARAERDATAWACRACGPLQLPGGVAFERPGISGARGVWKTRSKGQTLLSPRHKCSEQIFGRKWGWTRFA